MRKKRRNDTGLIVGMCAPIILSALFLTYAPVQADNNGLVTKKSANSVKETIDILEAALKKKGIGIWARVDHQANGATVDQPLRATTLLVFGNPKLGTPLMRSNQMIGLDLPMKALAWRDENDQVWISYNDPAYLASRHGIIDKDNIIKKMTGALDKLSDKAAGKNK